jgi:hypothetical protein
LELVLGFVPTAVLNIEKDKTICEHNETDTPGDGIAAKSSNIVHVKNIPELTLNDLHNNSEKGYNLNIQKF